MEACSMQVNNSLPLLLLLPSHHYLSHGHPCNWLCLHLPFFRIPNNTQPKWSLKMQQVSVAVRQRRILHTLTSLNVYVWLDKCLELELWWKSIKVVCPANNSQPSWVHQMQSWSTRAISRWMMQLWWFLKVCMADPVFVTFAFRIKIFKNFNLIVSFSRKRMTLTGLFHLSHIYALHVHSSMYYRQSRRRTTLISRIHW